jgi:hypothetical protein
LKAGYATGEDGWGDDVSLDLLTASVLLQAGIISRVAALPGAPTNGDIHILTATADAQKIAIRDEGAWVYLTPQEGWWVYDRGTNQYISFDGAAWVVFSGGGGGSGVPDGGTTGQVLTKLSDDDGDADWEDPTGGGGGGSGVSRVKRALVYLAADVDGADATGITIAFDSQLYDVGDWWDPAGPNHFTVPAGVDFVRVAAGVSLEGQTGEVYAKILKNNGNYPGIPISNRESGGSSDNISLASGVIPVVEGDEFSLFFYGAGANVIRLQETWMSVEEVIDFQGGDGLYRFGGSFTNTPLTAEKLLLHVVTDEVNLPANLVGSLFDVGVNPAGDWIADVQVNGDSIGTVTISSTGVVTKATTAASLVPGDVVALIAPVAVDGVIADTSFTFRSTGILGTDSDPILLMHGYWVADFNHTGDGDPLKPTMIEVNESDCYDPATGIFTAPTTGWYRFDAIAFGEADGAYQIRVVVNGGDSYRHNPSWDSTGRRYVGLDRTIKMIAGQTAIVHMDRAGDPTYNGTKTGSYVQISRAFVQAAGGSGGAPASGGAVIVDRFINPNNNSYSDAHASQGHMALCNRNTTVHAVLGHIRQFNGAQWKPRIYEVNPANGNVIALVAEGPMFTSPGDYDNWRHARLDPPVTLEAGKSYAIMFCRLETDTSIVGFAFFTGGSRYEGDAFTVTAAIGYNHAGIMSPGTTPAIFNLTNVVYSMGLAYELLS